MLGEVVHNSKRDIGKGTHGERDPLVREPSHEVGIFEAADAVVDPLSAQEIQRVCYVRWRPLFACVGNNM